MADTLVLYHGSCIDGFTAAWCAHKKLKDAAEYRAVYFWQSPPDVSKYKNVYLLDFAYKREDLVKMHFACNGGLLVLDHHISAARDLEGLSYCTLDMNRSGAKMAFDYFLGEGFPGAERLTNYVQDRDLWQWKLPHSKEVSAALSCYDFDFSQWDALASMFEEMGDEEAPRFFVRAGTAILKHQRNQVHYVAKKAKEVVLCDQRVLAVNSPLLASELGEYLAKDRPFSVVWYDNGHGVNVYSLRSRAGGVDCSEIAKKFGGGGHVAAAGFSAPTTEKVLVEV